MKPCNIISIWRPVRRALGAALRAIAAFEWIPAYSEENDWR
jgi:hypothetical protein